MGNYKILLTADDEIEDELICRYMNRFMERKD